MGSRQFTSGPMLAERKTAARTPLAPSRDALRLCAVLPEATTHGTIGGEVNRPGFSGGSPRRE